MNNRKPTKSTDKNNEPNLNLLFSRNGKKHQVSNIPSSGSSANSLLTLSTLLGGAEAYGKRSVNGSTDPNDIIRVMVCVFVITCLLVACGAFNQNPETPKPRR